MAKRIALGLTCVLAVYVVFAAWRGIDLLGAGTIPAQLLGVAVLVVTGIGAFLVIREVRFGYLIANLGKAMPEDLLLESASESTDNRSYLDRAIAQAHEDENSGKEVWQTWYRVGLGYDALKDRPAARQAMRHAIALFRGSGDDET